MSTARSERDGKSQGQLAAAALACGLALASASDGAGRSRPSERDGRETPAEVGREKAVRRGERSTRLSGNTTIRTQQRAGDSMAATMRKRPPGKPGDESDPAEAANVEESEVDRALRAEHARHDAALAKLRRDEQKATRSRDEKRVRAIRQAIAEEDAAHERAIASIREARQAPPTPVAAAK